MDFERILTKAEINEMNVFPSSCGVMFFIHDDRELRYAKYVGFRPLAV